MGLSTNRKNRVLRAPATTPSFASTLLSMFAFASTRSNHRRQIMSLKRSMNLTSCGLSGLEVANEIRTFLGDHNGRRIDIVTGLGRHERGNSFRSRVPQRLLRFRV